MKKYEFEQVTRHVVKEVFCNKCGLSISINDLSTCFEGSSVEIKSGYGSKRDGDSLVFELCDNCVDKILEGFVFSCEIKQEEFF